MSACIIHTYAPHHGGYAKVKVNGKTTLLHRVVYANANSVTLDEIADKVVRHTCDNRQCINSEHLLLGTQLDNVKDREDRNRGNAVRGAQHYKTKLTEDDVRYIRHSYYKQGIPVSALALKYSMSEDAVRNIANGTRWAHVK
jgi:hypothetical protein